MSETKDSAPVQFIDHIWRHMQKATSHSWLKINHSLSDGMDLAIRSGMEFDKDDFEVIAKRFRSGYWHSPERSYSTAVLYRNSSAYHALEHAMDRKPFIVKDASISTHTGDGPCGQGLPRIITGARFRWNGEFVTVTSFNDKAKSFTACSYIRDCEVETCSACKQQKNWPKDKILHRYRLTHQDIAEAKKAAKRA